MLHKCEYQHYSHRFIVGWQKHGIKDMVKELHLKDGVGCNHLPMPLIPCFWHNTPHACVHALIARVMWPTWGPPGDDRTQVGPMMVAWTLLCGCVQTSFCVGVHSWWWLHMQLINSMAMPILIEIKILKCNFCVYNDYIPHEPFMQSKTFI